jgi:hypothetical protein
MNITALILGLCAVTLALSGCSGGSDNSTSVTTGPDGSTTTVTNSGSSGSNGSSTTTGGTGNGTSAPQDLSCTAAVGGAGNGFATAGGQNIGGCSFGAASSKVVLQAADLPGGCSPYYTAAGGATGSSQPATVGQTYDSGTDFSMFCDATMTPNSTGTVTLVKA